jgi:beta-phosphoglucomutase
VSRVRSLEILLEIGGLTLEDPEKEKMAAQKNEWYIDYIRHMDASEILPGAAEYLQALRTKGVRTALGSASKNAPLILERLGISDLFDVVIDGNKVSKAKPDPEVFLRAAEALAIPATSCVVFEDAEAGIQAALQAEMGAVGIGQAAQLKEADIIISGLWQLVVLMG